MEIAACCLPGEKRVNRVELALIEIGTGLREPEVKYTKDRPVSALVPVTPEVSTGR